MDKCLIQEGGDRNTPIVTSCFVTRDTLWPDGSLGSHIVLTFIQLMELIHDIPTIFACALGLMG